MPRTLPVSLAVTALALASPALADSPFEGTWKIDDSATQYSQVPSVTSLKDGSYSCTSCTPAYTVPADGAFHPVAGRSAVDAMSVTVVDPHTLTYRWQKDGKTIGTETDKVGPDGNTLTYTDSWISPSGKTFTSAVTQARVGTALPGEHLATGKWRTVAVKDTSGTSSDRTFKVEGDTIMASSPSGMHYTATFGGPYVKVEGVDGDQEVAVARSGPRTMTERWKSDGKLTGVYIIKSNEDGKTQIVTGMSLNSGAVRTLTVHRVGS